MTGPSECVPVESIKEKNQFEVHPFVEDTITESRIGTLDHKLAHSQKSGRDNAQSNLKSREDYQLNSALFGYDNKPNKNNVQ